ncbi:MAG TPA: hypothetical protein VKA95_17070 [Nitrososphaeraceae archaeon]|nr:hypothetical protein [Nitrososphaeraceae archaeon]
MDTLDDVRMNNYKAEGYWAIISIDEVITRVKIVHKIRGKYGVIEDSKDGKYINRRIDVGDIIQVEK